MSVLSNCKIADVHVHVTTMHTLLAYHQRQLETVYERVIGFVLIAMRIILQPRPQRGALCKELTLNQMLSNNFGKVKQDRCLSPL